MAILLELDLTAGVIDDAPSDPVSRFMIRKRAVLRQVQERLEEAAGDPRVGGLLAKLGAPRMSLALAQELRDAVVEFRRSGKPAIAWAETFGELARGSSPYVLATGFDEIWLQPSGSIGLVGVTASGVFLRGALNRAHLEPLLGQRHEYKSAADALLRRQFSAAHRQATEGLATSLYHQVVTSVAEGRHLPQDQVVQLIDQAPLSAATAQQHNMVDHVGYRDAVRKAADERVGAKVSLLYLSHYRRRGTAIRKAAAARKPGVGLVTLTGAIRQGHSGKGPMGRAAGADTLCAAIRTAASDNRLKALVLRVNSPGGSYVASDAIWREVCRVREAGKPVVVSMGEVAASGGYFVAMGADVVMAQPATLTGSIGVYGGKVRVSALLKQVGVHVEAVARGRHAQMFSAQTGLSEEEWAKLDQWLDEVYADFTAKVAQGRGLHPDQVDAVARGRVWTGADAAGLGLVDQLGGLPQALQVARERASLAADAPVRLVPSPSPAQWLRRPRNSDHSAAFVPPWVLGQYFGGWGDLASLAAGLGLPSTGPLTMPQIQVAL